ncbi:sensor histidine kinase [Rhizocola hellebori]|nr:ATP-binding protein [Rhizocola hellebori]
MLIGAGGLAVGFGVGGVLLLGILATTLQRSSDNDARQTARDVAELLDLGALSQPVPVAGPPMVQVVDSAYRVRGASTNADALVPLLRPEELTRVQAGEVIELGADRGAGSGPLRVIAEVAGPAGDRQVVIVAMPAGQARESVRVLQTTLLIAYPLLVSGMALLAWRVVGATLRPVEDLRAGAEAIVHSGRPVRLPVPDGNDEIHKLAVTLNHLLDQQEAARTRQRSFVADAAHELRSPLANLRVQLEVAQHHGEPAAPEDLIADLDRLTRLVDDLLLLARADASPAALTFTEIELDELARGVAGHYRAARVPVHVTATDSPQWTIGDPVALQRVLANLLDNAVLHAHGSVTVTVTGSGQQTLMIVADDGPGIPAQDRERVFGRFTRLDDARARDAGGSGLGLAIVRDLVSRHHGSVQLDDANPGLRVTVTLPGQR